MMVSCWTVLFSAECRLAGWLGNRAVIQIPATTALVPERSNAPPQAPRRPVVGGSMMADGGIKSARR